MTRLGPLHLRSGKLLLADPQRRHLMLDRGAVHYCDGQRAVETVPWDRIGEAHIHFATTRFRPIGLVVGAAMSVLTILTHEVAAIETTPGSVRLTLRDGEMLLDLDPHHPGGYWSRSVIAAQRLLDKLIDDEPSRRLLGQPEQLMRVAKNATRRPV